MCEKTERAGVGVAVSGILHRNDSPAGFAAEAEQSYAMIRNNITKAAEKMPEENYSFRPSPDVRNFGQLISHIAG